MLFYTVLAANLIIMWRETTPEVYAVIMARHRKDFEVFATFTDVDGDSYIGNGKPEMMTEWGFKGTENPTVKIVQKRENKEQKEWQCEYFIYCG